MITFTGWVKFDIFKFHGIVIVLMGLTQFRLNVVSTQSMSWLVNGHVKIN